MKTIKDIKPWGEDIKRRLKESGISVLRLAKEAETTESTFYIWIKQDPKKSRVDRLEAAFKRLAARATNVAVAPSRAVPSAANDAPLTPGGDIPLERRVAFMERVRGILREGLVGDEILSTRAGRATLRRMWEYARDEFAAAGHYTTSGAFARCLLALRELDPGLFGEIPPPRKSD